jgi:hypothetical protein
VETAWRTGKNILGYICYEHTTLSAQFVKVRVIAEVRSRFIAQLVKVRVIQFVKVRVIAEVRFICSPHLDPSVISSPL